ncbi:MAG: GDP-mannose 4,6-dehydratase [bacterium]
MKVLITGITGFVGSHLAEYILADFPNVQILGLVRWRSPKENIRHILDKITLCYGDLVDIPSLKAVFNEHKPDIIFHLAAQSYVDFSFTSPIATLEANIIGTCNLLEAVKELKFSSPYDPIVHICSSSEVYGQVKEDEVPISEDNPFRPASPYAVSKVAEDMLGFQYWLSWKIKTIRTRLFTHSVSKWTPVILRDSKSGLIDIRYISEIRSPLKKGGYLSGKMLEDGTQIWDMERSSLEVWNDNKWTKIKRLSCHCLNNHKILEIASRGGVVDVTDNHSIVNEDGKKVKAGELALNDKVKLTSLPDVEITFLPEELAWLYGFFVAEGCVTGGRMRIDNEDINKIKRAQSILLKYLAVDSNIKSWGNMYRLTVRKPFNIAKSFYQNCYASDKNKKIPKLILNSDKKTKLSFLRGYNAGDGDENNKIKSEFYRFKTKSPILATGLCYLVETVLGVKYRIVVEHRDENRYFEIRCLSQRDTNKGKWLLKDDNSIVKITELQYFDEVWDFETENHWFHAGIGGNIVHNTGPRRGEVFAESAFAKQIAAIEAGLAPPVVKVGNLDSIRTFLDVRDAVKAYWLLVNKCLPGEVYNVGGAETMTVREMLHKLVKLSTTKNIAIEVDPARLRPSDVTLQIPCIDKFVQATGWKAEIGFDKTLEDLLKYWRNYYKVEKVR